MPAAAPTGPNIGWGGELWLFNDIATPVYQRVFGVMGELSLPDAQADDVEVTTFESANRRREYITGLTDPGEGSFEMNYVPGSPTDTFLLAAKNAGTVRKIKINLPNAAGIPAVQIETFGYVKGYSATAPLDNKMTAALTIKYSGAVTQTPI